MTGLGSLRRMAWFATVPLMGAVLGLAVALASSPSSLTPDRHQSTGVVQPSPSPIPSPSSTVTKPGILGDSSRLMTNGSNTVIALGPNLAFGSGDDGHTWVAVRAPANGAGLAVDPANPRHAIAGGATIQVTGDGTTWTATLSPPPGKGPYQPLAISPVESNVWFFAHSNRLLMTRDGSATWTELASTPALANSVLVPGQSLGQFYLASGNRVFALSNYGQQVTEEPAFTQGNVGDLAAVGGNRPTLFAKVAGSGVFVLNGTTWTKSGTLSGPIAAGAGGTILVGNGGGKLSSPGLVSYSTDGGATWRAASGLPIDQSVEALAGQSDSRAFFAYCYGGDIYMSTDGGRTWSLLTQRLRAG